MKNLVYLSVVLFAFAVSGCASYEEDQHVFNQVEELQAAEQAALQIKSTGNDGSNQGGDPR